MRYDAARELTGASILTRNFPSWDLSRTVLKRLRNKKNLGRDIQRDRERIETCNVTIVVVVVILLRVVLNSALNAAARDKRNEDEQIPLTAGDANAFPYKYATGILTSLYHRVYAYIRTYVSARSLTSE